MHSLTKLAVVALFAASVSSAFAGGKANKREGANAQSSSRRTATVAALKGDRGVARADRGETSSAVKQVTFDNIRSSETITFWVRE